MTVAIKSRIWRKGDKVAIELSADGKAASETCYLSLDHAAQLGGLLAKYAEDIWHTEYLRSNLGTDGYEELPND